jgi:hypothetical protein
MFHVGAYAVISSGLTHGKELLFVGGARYIPLDQLTPDPATGRVMARLYTPESMAVMLALPLTSLPELAALLGNSYTAPLVDTEPLSSALHKVWTGGDSSTTPATGAAKLNLLVEWMRRQPSSSARNSAALVSVLVSSPPLATALGLSDAAYYHTALGPTKALNALPQVVLDAFGAGSLPLCTLGVACGGVWSCPPFVCAALSGDATAGAYSMHRYVCRPNPAMYPLSNTAGAYSMHRGTRRIMYSILGRSEVTERLKANPSGVCEEEVVSSDSRLGITLEQVVALN